jgi:DNA-binding transcriptional ArsR family regulator
MNSNDTLQKEFIIDNADTMKTIADPLRLRILRNLRRPRTVKELAGRLDLPPTKLYYHVNLLEKAEMIRVVETHVVSGIIEKVYQVTARSFRLADDLLMNQAADPGGISEMVNAIFDDARGEVQRAVANGALKFKPNENNYETIWRAEARLSEAELAEFHERLANWIKDIGKLAQANRERDELPKHSILIVFHPVEKNDHEEDQHE